MSSDRDDLADRGGGRGKRRRKRRKRRGGTGAVFGAQVLRFSSIHTVGITVANVATLATVIVAANFLDPAEFGTFGLLLFLTALLNMLFNLASKQGTLKRSFGADDEDDEEEDEEEGRAQVTESSPRSLGTGLILTALISTAGTGLVIALAPQIGDLLLQGEGGRDLIAWAAAAGGASAVHRLASLIVWMERRPVPSMFLEAARPVLMLAAILPLLIAGAGVEGAIAGTAIGTGAAALLCLPFLRRGVQLTFDPREAATIMRIGSQRIPIVTSFFTVSYSDIFILSRFVAPADLGIYQLASRAGFLISFLAGGIRRALRPLRRTTTYRAVEAEYGQAVTGGVQLGYFFLGFIGLLLATTLLADTLVKIAPASYADAAPLIPLLAAGLAGPTAFRMVNKSVKIRRKRRVFIVSVVLAALMFIGLSVALIPVLDLYGAPVAMLIAFAIPGAYVLYRSQTGKQPIAIPYRSLGIALVGAAACAAGYHLLSPPGIVLPILGAIGFLLLWGALLLVTGAVPRHHWGALLQMALAFAGRGRPPFDPDQALGALSADERAALRMAIVEGRPLEEIARELDAGGRRDGAAVGEWLVRALRRAADEGGRLMHAPTERDAQIGEYLFSDKAQATRDAAARRLVRSGDVEPADLHELEEVIRDLERAPSEAWRGS